MRTVLSLLVAGAALAGCGSSPPVHYYTLQGPAAPAPASAATPAGFLIEVQPVSLSTQADQPQLMVRTGDGSVSALYSERWSSPLGDELRGALSDALKRELGALDVQAVKPGPGAAVWRVQTDVQRFDLVSGSMAQLDATWRVRPVNMKGSGLLCRSLVTESVSEAGVPALIAAQQRAVVSLAGVMASAMRGQAPAGTGSVQMLGCSALKD
ncbi:PqiC family protein [Achromobacter sp. Bel]|uniref:PqiC family protein n=1 Tax=Achromobacter sp. Bel TaxID=2727415 RepID=UPI00145CE381|nr:PqiC family protein [Achromobacter sp. Bel]NMK48401.1 membrane integrity-associated transporter subunit PqiC [Achromobacter sp. Bel]